MENGNGREKMRGAVSVEAIVCSECKKTSPGDALHCNNCGAPFPAHSFSSSPSLSSRSSLLWDDLDPSSVDDPESIDDEDPSSDEFALPEQSTWQQVVEEVTLPPAAYPPRPPQPSQTFRFWRSRYLYSSFWRSSSLLRNPKAAFWLFLVVLLCLLSIGTFGVTHTWGQGLHASSSGTSLQVSPQSMEIGTTLTLHGSGFVAHSHIGLTRDASIPIYDTANDTTISADSKGDFTDTVVVLPDWQSGSHVINAEDAATHRTASFPILVIGNGAVLRPPHLKLSVTSLDFGSGDQATNSTKAIEIINTGSGQISWRSTTTQSWLLVSPNNGQFFSEAPSSVMIAVDRSNLQPGNYNAQVLFQSNAGSVSLPIHMHVTPLGKVSSSVLQVTPGVLSFAASDGGSNPDAQVITVSNPGTQDLQWSVQSKVPWLTVSPPSSTVHAGGSTAVTVHIQAGSLLPGSYNGTLTFQGQNASTLHSPQQVYVNLTIAPRCSLQLAPTILTFDAAIGQTTSSPQTVSLQTPKPCSNSLSWSATSNTKWLLLKTSHGQTPANLAVTAIPTGLTAGNYTGSVTVTTSSGSQVVLVNLVVAQASAPMLRATTAPISFTAIAGQTTPATQTLTISNSGGSPLLWSLNTTTVSGGSWLSALPSTGTLAAHTSAAVTVSASARSFTTAATYSGNISIHATTSAGSTLPGGNQSVSANFAVQSPCALSSTASTLTFTGVTTQTNPPAQAIPLSLIGTCSHAISWTATAHTTSGGSWLSVTPSGTISAGQRKSATVSVLLKGLFSTSYSGSISLSAYDSVTHSVITTFPAVSVTLNVQPACTLQAPSVGSETFSADAGTAATSQSFTISVVGTCNGAVSIQPTAILDNGSGWLTLSASSATIQSGQSVTLTVTADATALSPGTYTGTISIVALDSGIAIVGSPQSVSVTLDASAPPTPPDLQATPTSMSFSVSDNQLSQTLTIQNVGGSSLDWSATLPSDAVSVVTLSSTSGSDLSSGNSTIVTVAIDAANLTSDYTTHITLNSSNAANGDPLSGQSVAITIHAPVTPDVPSPTPV
jgi:hypothetical protein